MFPTPPVVPCSGRPKRPSGVERCRAYKTPNAGEERCRGLLLAAGVLPVSGAASSGDYVALDQCAALAAQMQATAAELTSACRATGLNEAALRQVVLEHLFPAFPNPQDPSNPTALRKSAGGAWGAQEQEAVYAAPSRSSGSGANTIVVRAGAYRSSSSGGANANTAGGFAAEEVKRAWHSPREEGGKGMVNKDSISYRHMVGPPDQVYELAAKMGEGTFGLVCKARHRQTGQTHAIKSVPKYKVSVDELWTEIITMKTLDHPHIMRLYATFEDEYNIYMASEICAGGEFFDTIARTGHLEGAVAARLFRQILSAVIYLHGKLICHRDLKPENFLVAKKGQLEQLELKLIDFGTAKNFGDGPMTTKVCTFNYVAPEVLKRGDNQYTEKVDVWSCGVILYMMLCGSMPFEHENDMELMKRVKKGKYDFVPEEIWGTVSENAKALVRSMLCVNVAARGTAVESYKYEWFEEAAHLRPKVSHIDENEMLEQMTAFLEANWMKRVALQIIARQVNDDTISMLRNLFLSVDADQSGTLTMDEMDWALRALEVHDDQREHMIEVMLALDQDGSGAIEYTEFIAAAMNPSQYLRPDVCRAAFDLLDVDGDGVLSRDDLEKAWSCSANISHCIDQLDHNGDGQVNFEEFMHLMMDTPKHHG